MNTLIGTYPLVGSDSQLFLPFDLRDYLEDYGITTLHHACNISHGSQGYWLAADDLELGGDWKILWENYISSLEHGRIHLNLSSD